MPISLCSTDDISDPGCRGFEIKHKGLVTNLFVVHKDGQFHAFINSCPHTGATLDWQENQFLDQDKAYIQCSTHGSLFEIHTGFCIWGPCVGDTLSNIQLSIQNNTIIVDIKNIYTSHSDSPHNQD